MHRTTADDDWVTSVGEHLPVSPLSGLGLFLAVTIGVRIAAENLSTQIVLESAFPFVAASAVVFVDRWLVARDVSIRDRITVFAYGLGGFLAAALVTALHLLVLSLHGTSVPTPLYLTLMSGTIGVAAGTVAGVYEIRQRAAAREARRQRARFEEFASVVSHDLRNPLGVAQGRLQETFRSGDPQHLREVHASLDRMDELIEETLSVARSGSSVENPKTVSLFDVARDAWEGVDTGEATLETVSDRSIRMDVSRVKNLFENLYRNSIDHGRDGVTVRVGSTRSGFFVEDDGPGIPESDRECVLERGFSTAAEGSGLGLAIVRAIADAHGWDVRVTESEQGGARFEFVHE